MTSKGDAGRADRQVHGMRGHESMDEDETIDIRSDTEMTTGQGTFIPGTGETLENIGL
jgi:hypothetical protein